jgi:hypothetical protein
MRDGLAVGDELYWLLRGDGSVCFRKRKDDMT